MKGSGKPISSPGRTEKFPPPLMRFLRSNVGSRSRGRTRASPMFMRKNKNNVAIETTQEPSSPKVTCIGQVRVRRSSKSAAHGGGSGGTRRLSSIRKNQQKQKRRPCCCNFQWKLHRPKSLISVLRKWVRCFRFGYCGKRAETVDSSSRVEPSQRFQSRVSTSSTTDSIENVATTNAKIEPFVTENEEGFMSSNSNPPKNALLLTRCRSAPYRSSSLASRFWGSPLNHSSDTESEIPKNNLQELEEKPVLEKPISPKGENGELGSRKSHGSEEMQSSINGGSSREEEEEEDEDKNGGRGAYVHPLLLTRCKSEPARTGERLNPIRFT